MSMLKATIGEIILSSTKVLEIVVTQSIISSLSHYSSRAAQTLSIIRSSVRFLIICLE